MNADDQKLLDDFKALVENSRERGLELKTEFDKLIPSEIAEVKAEGEEGMSELEDITNAISKIKLSQLTKLRKFSKGENFSRFCERFLEYIYITKMCDPNLYVFFLQNVDDETYATLKAVTLIDQQKNNAEQFCDVYKRAIYGDEGLSLKNEVMDCKQKTDESISDYAYRLREAANIAYSDPNAAAENCLLAFLRGIKNAHIKRKLNESVLAEFNEAVKYAKRLERVEGMVNEEPEVNSILKESSVTFQPSKSDRSSSNTDSQNKRSYSSDSWRSNSPYDSRSRSRDRDRSYSRGRSREQDRNMFHSPVRSSERDWSRSRSRGRSFEPNDRYWRPNRFSDSGGRNYQRNNTISRDYRTKNPHRLKVCYFCQKPGHIFRTCWSRNTNNRNQFPMNNDFRGHSRGRGPWNQNNHPEPTNDFWNQNAGTSEGTTARDALN